MRLNRTRWTVQVLLALVFLFSGSMKLILPLEAMAAPVALPWWFLRFLGVAEVTGALGLILPGLFGIRTDLTPLAASGLVIIMIGATTITAFAMAVAPALVPMAIGLLAAFVGYGRWRLVPVSAASRRPMLVTVS